MSMTYEAWRISYQDSEQAARAAFADTVALLGVVDALREKLQAGGSTYEKVIRLEAENKELKSDLAWARSNTMEGR